MDLNHFFPKTAGAESSLPVESEIITSEQLQISTLEDLGITGGVLQ